MNAEWPNLWHLQVFLTVLQARNLSVAASQAQLTQPAVSQAVAGLESYFGISLLRRTHGLIEPTEAGIILGERADRTLDFLSDGLRDAAGASRRKAIQLVRTISAARLDALVAIVRHQGFAAAARASGVSAPTLHRAARDLESSLGVELFEATSFGVRPSRQADAIAQAAALAFAEIRQAKAEISAHRGLDSGRTFIGAMPLARSHLVPAAIEEFSRIFPDHRVTIVEGAYDDLLAGLRRGSLDVLVGALREDMALRDVIQDELFVDQLSLVMRAGHPLEKVKRVTKTSLLKYPWIAPRVESPLRQHFESLFAPGKRPIDLIECNSLSAARVILMNSDRLALLSDAQIRYEKQAGMLSSRSAPGPVRKRSIGVTKRRSWRPTKTQSKLLRLLERNAPSTQSHS